METAGLKRFAQGARSRLMGELGAKLDQVLAVGSLGRRERPGAVLELERLIREEGRDRIVDRVAYTWFNRFCALRFMDVNGYNAVGVVSPGPGASQPEILAEAKGGHVDEGLERVLGLLAGNEDEAAYGVLLVGVCNGLSAVMPGLFERIDDYTELLLPGDLLSANGILAAVREAMTAEVCEDVEVIGWLYQFYIAERKDEVFAGLKGSQKIERGDIPVATQLFTPDWIVRYLVENSLGRLWMLNRPGSRLVDQMAFYVDSHSPVPISYLKISSPEEIKVCDPACGSGHILVYAFDLLYAIYEEEGYSPAKIPGLILEHNLFGIDIDERAVWLAQFALLMKGRGRDRRFLSRGVLPQVCLLEGVVFEEGELGGYFDVVGRDLFSGQLLELLHQFKEGDHFGSLIRPVVVDCDRLNQQKVQENLFLNKTHEKVLKVLKFAEFLSCRYHVVVANPPYMGGKGMNDKIKAFLQDEYKDVKSDLFSAFIVRNTELALKGGQLGFMTPFVWMFISSYEKLRDFLISSKTITSLIQLEYSGFEGATVPICTFTIENSYDPSFKGGYIRLSDFKGADNQAPKALEAIKNPDCGWFYRAAAADFKKIPGGAIAYWVSESIHNAFVEGERLGDKVILRKGMVTADNDLFIRLWHEVSFFELGKGYLNRKSAQQSYKKWFPYTKGGEYRKWYGNNVFVVNWQNDGEELQTKRHHKDDRVAATNFNLDYIFNFGATYSSISSSNFSIRFTPAGFLYDQKGAPVFSLSEENLRFAISLLNSKPSKLILTILCPTLDFNSGSLAFLPVVKQTEYQEKVDKLISCLINISQTDWNSYETSWDFTTSPILQQPNPTTTPLPTLYTQHRQQWAKTTQQMQQLEQENNRIFIQAYGLQNELTPQIPLKEITLTNNPHYRYGIGECEIGSEEWEEMESRLQTDTIKELISYAIGCLFGRYSLNKPGLILANQNQTLENYHQQIPEPTLPPTPTNVIPILDGDWFPDDLTPQIRTFLRTALGTQHYQQNLNFIETALGKPLQKYLLKDLYPDHLKRYKKRPIYWLYSSPKNHFNALIYMHRYQNDTTSIVLDYLRQYQTKITTQQTQLQNILTNPNSPKPEQTKATRTLQTLKKILTDLDNYERDILYPLALQQMAIDLDDGVKTNYPKLGKALKPIPGLT